MRDVDKDIEQAKTLSSEDWLIAHDVLAIRDRTIREYGNLNSFGLIFNAFNYGFIMGYRLGEKQKYPTDSKEQAADEKSKYKIVWRV